jgi:hypothetical protein
MGMDEFYKDFQNVPNTNQKEIDIEKIYNKVITTGKDLNLITDIPDAYPLVVMFGISKYLKAKYSNKEDKKYVDIMTAPIDIFVKEYKELNPSTGGKRVTEVLASLSRFVEYVKNRNTIQKLTGANDKEQ